MVSFQPEHYSCSDVNVNWTLFGAGCFYYFCVPLLQTDLIFPNTGKGQKSISLFTVADKLFIFVTAGELFVYDRLLHFLKPESN